MVGHIRVSFHSVFFAYGAYRIYKCAWRFAGDLTMGYVVSKVKEAWAMVLKARDNWSIWSGVSPSAHD